MQEDKNYTKFSNLTHSLLENHECSEKPTRENPYGYHVHEYIRRDCIYAVGNTRREIMFPVPQEHWTKSFHEIHKNYREEPKPWSQYSFYGYIMDCLVTRANITRDVASIQNPWFGYAVSNGKLFPCAFITMLRMTRKVEGMDSMIPEYWVFDPIALTSGHTPDCYIGVPVELEFLQDWLINRYPVNQLLENQIEYQTKKFRAL